MSEKTVFQLKRKISQTMLADRFHFERRLKDLEKSFYRLSDKDPNTESLGRKDDSKLLNYNKKLEKLAFDINASCQKVLLRKNLNLKYQYDPELPICVQRDEISKLIAQNQVVIICGETGSGKSTQLPKICLDLGRGVFGMIGHTQPRRIAARSVAQRIADEMSTSLGQGVGYKIRFTDETGPSTLVKLMTDGILLAESQTDPFFQQYDTIIIDEAHERSLNIDFLLGMMKRILPKRRDLKLIITSATIDAQRFADHFSYAGKPAPIIEVSGRTYPIEILYRPVDEWKNGAFLNQDNESSNHSNASQQKNNDHKLSDEDCYEQSLLNAVDELSQRDRGDILIFMPTERDIFETAKLLKNHRIPGDDSVRKTAILPLYARLPAAEQQKIFKPDPWRKIVIATNVAESSLTVPGIRYVIDPGTARISRYSARSKTQRLPIEPVSQASADQRAGRCGRVGPGVCIRLYSQEDFLARERYTTPEIRRTNLASVILQTKSLNLGVVEHFPFIDPPRTASIQDGYKTLFELGALDHDFNLTPIGRKLSRLPVDPRIGRIILAAEQENCLHEILIIASIMEIQDPRERPHDQQEKADQKHLPFLDENSDFLSSLKIWDFWQELNLKLSRSQLRKACRENFLSFNRMKEWTDIHLQLLQLARELKLKLNSRQNDYDSIHRAILTGLLYGIAKKTETPEYQSTGNGKFFLWPGSGLFHKKHSWIVASERVETTKKYLRTSAKINPDWIEPLAKHLLQRTYHQPHWLRETGYVHAYEQVTLYGLTIVPKRRINFGPVDPQQSRKIFIQNALVEQDFDCDLEFFQKNAETIKNVEKIQAKLRKYDFLRGQDALLEFYENRIPENVYDKVTLKQWHKRLSTSEKKNLLLTDKDLCREEVSDKTLQLYPDHFPLFQGSMLPIEYHFKPGDQNDGVSLIVPTDGLGQIESRQVSWLIPGLLEQKVIAMLKSLPKEIRRNLVPIPETAKLIVQSISFGYGNFEEILARKVSQLVGRLVSPFDFAKDKMPLELLMNIKVVDSQGKMVAEGRDLKELQNQLGVQTHQTIEAVTDTKWHQDGLTRWTFGSLPESVTLHRNGMSLKAFPALCDPIILSMQNNLLISPSSTNQNKTLASNENPKTKIASEIKKESKISSNPFQADQKNCPPQTVEKQLFGFSIHNVPISSDDSKTNVFKTLKSKDTKTNLSLQSSALTRNSSVLTRNNESISSVPVSSNSVSLRLFDSQEKASYQHRYGVFRLFCLLNQKDLKLQAKWIPNLERLRVLAQRLPDFEIISVCSILIGIVASEMETCSLPRNEGEFNRFVQNGASRIGVATQEITIWISKFLEAYHFARLAIERNRRLFPEAALEASEHLKRLLPSCFYLTTSWKWLKEFPRFLLAISMRFEKLKAGGSIPDQQFMNELHFYQNQYQIMQLRHQNAGILDSELECFRWMLEEYRVSLFAQQLGTSLKISSVRLEKQWKKIVQ
ncbi:MAG: ATP-dependent RNA helicase HrpA [Planctomycetia bacterium]|nr:ATP-dependent RNA helicase HrpA [Planctomycetia bacterium]